MLSPRHAVQTTRHDRDLHAPAARGLPATLPTRARGIALLAAAALSLVLTGCASNPPRSPLPAELAGEAQIPGIPGARYWGDEPPPRLDEWLSWPEQALESSYGGIMDRPHAYLVVSGGGGDGAYGAGLLVGWSAHGSRPEFQIVTGVSTGAIIAPFAFLGAAHDSTLREIYTSFASDDLITRRGLLAVVRGDAAFDTAPLRRLLDRYLDDAYIAAIAAEHRRGRTLLVATTNLDAARPVIWDLTRIAASGHPYAGRLIRDVILASAAIPAAFPPVTFTVTAGGGTYDELHVDGVVTSQLFCGPPG
ncbi:MAG TPA: patatin-like phospholipase family protein, partial [Steroidobacteraceae bacterium]|nr:patatin-like phospholipase family protein [Steroidobacteraceae bacterium]